MGRLRGGGDSLSVSLGTSLLSCSSESFIPTVIKLAPTVYLACSRDNAFRMNGRGFVGLPGGRFSWAGEGVAQEGASISEAGGL